LRAAAGHGQGAGDCGGGRPGERGELVQALGGCGEQFAAGQAGSVAGDLAGEPARHDGQQGEEVEVVGGGQPAEIGGEHLPGQRGEGAGAVAVQPQAVFDGGDQGGPFLAAGERPGADEAEPPGDLPAAGAGQQPGACQADPGVDEGGGYPLGEVLQRVGRFGAGPGGGVEVVQFIDFTDRGSPYMAFDLR